jgi:hypothetical protein
MAASTLDTELAALAAMDLDVLRHVWRTRMRSDPPKVSASLLRLGLAYAMQEKALSGLSKAAEKQLKLYGVTGRMSEKPVSRREPRPGMRLVRVWNDVAHVVTVSDVGEIQWQGKTWRSLSEVARAITGTQWSGPKFFGLRDKANAA